MLGLDENGQARFRPAFLDYSGDLGVGRVGNCTFDLRFPSIELSAEYCDSTIEIVAIRNLQSRSEQVTSEGHSEGHDVLLISKPGHRVTRIHNPSIYYLLRNFVNIPRTHGDDNGVFAVERERLADGIERIERAGVAAPTVDDLRERMVRDTEDRLFARGINGSDDDLVGVRERFAELRHEIARA